MAILAMPRFGILVPVATQGTTPGEVRMTFGEHLDELRRRLWKSILALLLCFLVAAVFYRELVAFVARPHQKAMALLKVPPEQAKLLSGSYTHPWTTIMKLLLIVSCFAASPVIAYQFWKFVGAGLYARERRWALTFAPASFFLFCAGCVFGYLVLIPYALYGLSSGLNIDIVTPMFTFGEYLTLVMNLTVIMGVVFEMPLLMLFFAKIGVCSASTYNKWRRYAIVGNFFLAAVLTPADVISMLVMVVPLLVLYEIGVVLAWIFGKPRGTGEASPRGMPVWGKLTIVGGLLAAVGIGGFFAYRRFKTKTPATPGTIAAESNATSVFPLTLGDRWRYSAPTDSEEWRVTAHRLGSSSAAEYELTVSSSRGTERRVLQVLPQGPALVRDFAPTGTTRDFRPPYCLVPWNPSVGMGWCYRGSVTRDGTEEAWSIDSSVLGVESLATPGGTYECFRVEVKGSRGATRVEETLWYARGVGLVKSRARFADRPDFDLVLREHSRSAP